jgi:hypothetical protein
MRLIIKADKQYFYDIGLRNKSKLSKFTSSFGEYHPRYLEDFIERYGKHNIKIVSFGKLKEEKDTILKLFE